MTDFEKTPNPDKRIRYNPDDFGIDPLESEIEEAIVVMSEGDLKLFLSEWALSAIERQYLRGEIDSEAFHVYQDELFSDIARRREELGLPGRPNFPTS
jgi:hypothetical protein